MFPSQWTSESGRCGSVSERYILNLKYLMKVKLKCKSLTLRELKPYQLTIHCSADFEIVTQAQELGPNGFQARNFDST